MFVKTKINEIEAEDGLFKKLLALTGTITPLIPASHTEPKCKYQFSLMFLQLRVIPFVDTHMVSPYKFGFLHFEFMHKHCSTSGSGCGTVDSAVDSDNRGPGFESSHRQLL